MRKISLVLAASCLLCLPACDGSSKDAPAGSSSNDEDKDKGKDDKDDQDKDDDDDSNPLSGLANNPLAAMFTKKLDEPGPYDPPKQSPNYAADQPHLRVLKLSGSVGEVEVFDPLAFAGGGGGSVRTRALLDKLDELAAEPKLEGLVLRVGDLSMDMARGVELRAALVDFKADGARKLHCHAESLSNTSYYLLSVCDELAMVPVGTLMVPGPAATPVHLKGLLDKLEVQADFLHVGAFKGAAEPLTRDAPSPEMLETLGALVDQAYVTMVSGIAQGRGASEEEVRGWIDQALFTSESAAEGGLIDKVEAWEPFLARVSGERGWKNVTLQDKPWSDPLALQRFLGMSGPKRPSKPHVALVYAVGNIIDGKGGGALGATSEIASGQLVPVLDRLAADDKVAAVVLRIDSGGGSAQASEQIWHAVERLKASKPVVVSMAGVAASGGYYIAAGANQIYADTDTVTGSIGVVGGKLVLGKALESFGIKSFAVTKGEHALLWSPMQAWTPEERTIVYAMMEQTYDVFVERVAAGRNMDRDAVHEIAQGRVWTGVAAKERGLVDELGGLEQALAAATKLGKVEPDVGLEVYPGEPTIKDILGSFEQLVAVQAGARADSLPIGLGMVIDELAASVGPEGRPWIEAVRASLRTTVALQGSTVWAVEWTQAVR
ncbi:signal peptide peptidase SppA, 36K type [Enhygromyxa salina]|uniref:Signal peptide peptidase SppA, 36K type n=1 Tax=Enhygromyxa salina TaxID=215803 RepID=A0A0C2D1I2_9BACT|nr:signal peptide peptidase SppA [Enhygromyxa salina]KIG17101.1 signal peptide peptidase SppA, 36K type [Enhygromyxa salina]